MRTNMIVFSYTQFFNVRSFSSFTRHLFISFAFTTSRFLILQIKKTSRCPTCRYHTYSCWA